MVCAEMSLDGTLQRDADLYVDTYYDFAILSNKTRATIPAYDRVFGFVHAFGRGFLVFLLRAGLLLLQLGSIPVQDTTLILVNNVVDLSVSTVGYGMIGFILAYGQDVGEVIGTGMWINSEKVSFDDAVTGWCFVVTSTGIFTTMVAGRMHVLGHGLVCFIIASIVEPLVIHWIWNPKGFMRYNELQNELVGYRDMGGCVPVHVLGGFVSLIALFFLGRRLVLLRNIDESSLPPSSPGTCTIGYFLFVLGMFSLSMPNVAYTSDHVADNYVGKIVMNNLLAFAGGTLAALLLEFIMDTGLHYWSMLWILQGGVSGMVVISAGVDIFSPIVSLFLGASMVVISFFMGRMIFSTPFEDYCNLVSVHLFCGLIGTILPPVFGEAHGFAFSNGSSIRLVAIHFCWQVICSVIFLFVFVVTFLSIFTLLYCLGLIHNRFHDVEHRRAMAFLSRGPERSCTQRLFKLGRSPQMLMPGNKAKDPVLQAQICDKIPDNWNHHSSQLPNVTNSKNSPRGTVIAHPVYQTYRMEVLGRKTPFSNFYDVIGDNARIPRVDSSQSKMVLDYWRDEKRPKDNLGKKVSNQKNFTECIENFHSSTQTRKEQNRVKISQIERSCSLPDISESHFRLIYSVPSFKLKGARLSPLLAKSHNLLS